MSPPTDCKGLSFAPGQLIVTGRSLGTLVTLEERTVAIVHPDAVYTVPQGGESKPRHLRHPERAYIVR